MKSKLLLAALAASLIGSAEATIVLNTQFGTAFNSGGAPVAAGTLYALVIDTDNNSTFAGGFGVNTTLGAVGANSVFTTGQQLTLGQTLGGDTIFHLGAFDGAGEGITAEVLSLTLGVNGVLNGRSFAIYWFPGATLANRTVGTQVGGMNSNLPADGGLDPMIMPADGATVNIGAATADGSGTQPNIRFTAVDLVPEPSAALLGLLGAVGLIRRRR
ncbi:hypothetical protein OKA05_05975 [Luteolibacter arcticus]|uniref:PEP-CTERM protein-sorting domain-containing protein n=1 Tax=Luteolibacter arcticus TaxID=1581411 RepID=A0ABT3GEQ0_9BACT|nr:hypothetical protein [Luteolibacter arcticus]MCW1922092.1 hypothetical protein [Luteolibacter arcticus]